MKMKISYLTPLLVLSLFLGFCSRATAQGRPHAKATDNAKVPVPKVKFSGQLLSGNTLLRACAGAVDDHAAMDPDLDTHNDFQYRAHTRQVDMAFTVAGKPMSDTTVTLRFEGNKGHDYGDGRQKKTARLHKTDEAFDSGHPWKETLDVTSDSQGKASVWVLSSDVICQPKLQAVQKGDSGLDPVKLGEVGCDFAASITFRHFVNPVDPDDTDDFGWIFDFPSLMNSNNDTRSTPAKVYLKFKVFPNESDDYTYTDADGREHGNWQFVNGHDLIERIASVEVTDPDTGQNNEIKGTPQELRKYAFVVDSDSGATSDDEVTATRTTTADGGAAPQAYVFAGPNIDDVSMIYVEAEDQTERDE